MEKEKKVQDSGEFRSASTPTSGATPRDYSPRDSKASKPVSLLLRVPAQPKQATAWRGACVFSNQPHRLRTASPDQEKYKPEQPPGRLHLKARPHVAISPAGWCHRSGQLPLCFSNQSSTLISNGTTRQAQAEGQLCFSSQPPP